MLDRERMRGLLVLLFALCGCQKAPLITIKLNLQLTEECGATTPGNPPPPASCEQMKLDCADRIWFIATSPANGSSVTKCVATSDLGEPKDLCALVARPSSFAVFDTLPSGSPLVFSIKALKLSDPSSGCDDPNAEFLFMGMSDPIPIDGKDHEALLKIKHCASCPAPNSGIADLGAWADMGSLGDGGSGSSCPPGEQVSSYAMQGGATCCPTIEPSACLAPGMRCDDGTPALLPPGGCCGVCN